jgi:DNA-directed RNA polymerase subunit omega
MARITVEDCLEKISSQYDLVLMAKERAMQLNSGEKSLVPEENDKNTVISLREIGEGKISIKTLEDSAINKLRKPQSSPTELEDLEVEENDDFDKIYKGEISKSGAAILPSKRVRKIPEKIVAETTEEPAKEESENLDTENKETASEEIDKETVSEEIDKVEDTDKETV